MYFLLSLSRLSFLSIVLGKTSLPQAHTISGPGRCFPCSQRCLSRPISPLFLSKSLNFLVKPHLSHVISPIFLSLNPCDFFGNNLISRTPSLHSLEIPMAFWGKTLSLAYNLSTLSLSKSICFFGKTSSLAHHLSTLSLSESLIFLG
ncbi:hypothetical protein AMTRI_Chr11g152570 [Amborella trichopoda]